MRAPTVAKRDKAALGGIDERRPLYLYDGRS